MKFTVAAARRRLRYYGAFVRVYAAQAIDVLLCKFDGWLPLPMRLQRGAYFVNCLLDLLDKLTGKNLDGAPPRHLNISGGGGSFAPSANIMLSSAGIMRGLRLMMRFWMWDAELAERRWR
jgi:hypothetical protein